MTSCRRDGSDVSVAFYLRILLFNNRFVFHVEFYERANRFVCVDFGLDDYAINEEYIFI